MPKIPLYNEGRGQAVSLATGSLGPRASSAAFEAPSQAMARLGGQVSQIAFEFGMREKQQQTKAAILDYETSIKEEAKDFIRNDTSTYTSEFEGKFNTFKADRLDRIKNDTSLTNSQKTAVQQSVQSMLAHQTLVGKQESHNRGLMRNGQVYMNTLDSNQKMMATLDTSDPAYMRMDAQNKQIFADAMLTGIKLPTTEQGFYAGLKDQRIVIDITSAVETNNKDALKSTRAEVDRQLADGEINGNKHAAYLKALRQGEVSVNANAYEQNLGLIGQAAQNMTTQEANDAIKDLQSGQAITVTTPDGEVTIDPKDMGNKNTMVLSSKLAGLTKDIYNEYAETHANNLADVMDASPEERAATLKATLDNISGTDEERADITLSGAAILINDAEQSIADGTMSSSEYEEVASLVESMIAQPIGIGQGSISQRVDTRGQTANTILNKISTTRKKINEAKGDMVTRNMLMKSFENNTFNATVYRTGTKDPQAQGAIDLMMLQNGTTKEGIKKTINTLAANNITSDSLAINLKQAVTLSQTSFDFNTDAGKANLEFIKGGFAQMDLMDARGGGVLERHIGKTNLAIYKSINEYRSLNPDLESAIEQAKIASQRTEDAKLAGRKDVERAVNGVKSEIGNIGFFGIGDREVLNIGDIERDLKERARLYADLGLGADRSLELAKEDLADIYTLSGNMVIKKTKTLPTDIDDLSKLAGRFYLDANPDIDADELGIDENNFSLVELYAGRYVLHMDGVPISTTFRGKTGTKFNNEQLDILRDAYEVDPKREEVQAESAEKLSELRSDVTGDVDLQDDPNVIQEPVVNVDFLSPDDMQMEFAGKGNFDKTNKHIRKMFENSAQIRGEVIDFITTEQPIGQSQAVPSEAE